MKALLSIPLLLVAFQASADCTTTRPGDAPSIVDGATADKHSMYQSQIATKAYVEEVDTYLSCFESFLHPMQYNALINKAVSAADDYNQELKKFRSNHAVAAS